MHVHRHFAFFGVDGNCTREWAGDVPEPPGLDLSVTKDERDVILNMWATWVSQPAPDEIGLDVTRFHYPTGDFVYATFDRIDRTLAFAACRKYIQVTPSRMTVDSNSTSPRPVRSVPSKWVIDITDTDLEPYYGTLFGQLVEHAGRWSLVPYQSTSPMALPPINAQPDWSALISHYEDALCCESRKSIV